MSPKNIMWKILWSQMKLDEKYPHAHANSVYGLSFFRNNSKNPCMICGEMTKWLHTAFRGSICSEECNVEKWREYQKKLGEKNGN